MGHTLTEIITDSEHVIGVLVDDIATVPSDACEGQMTFLKRSAGDEIYIHVKGATPSATDYYIILTDDVPQYTEFGIIPGKVQAIGNNAASKLSTSISYSIWKK